MSASLHDVRFTPKSGHQNLAGVSASAAPISHDEARCLAPRWTTAAGSGVVSRSDHLVGAEDKRLWKSETERVCCLEI
jgi:hypothetical protein